MSAKAEARRSLSVTELGIVKDRLSSARQDLRMARMHVRGCPEAIQIVDAAGQAVRAALDRITTAYRRGVL